MVSQRVANTRWLVELLVVPTTATSTTHGLAVGSRTGICIITIGLTIGIRITKQDTALKIRDRAPLPAALLDPRICSINSWVFFPRFLY